MEGKTATCLVKAIKSERGGLIPMFFADMEEEKTSDFVASVGAAGAAVLTGDSAGFG